MIDIFLIGMRSSLISLQNNFSLMFIRRLYKPNQFFFFQDTPLDRNSDIVKQKQNDNPFVQPVQTQTVVDMKGILCSTLVFSKILSFNCISVFQM